MARKKSPTAKSPDLQEYAKKSDEGATLTTNQGTVIADNQNSLKLGERGPSLLEDFILREKITHFDHERIPERIVHARGSAAHGFFEVYESQEKLTKAGFLTDPSRRTPVFVRFSTVAGGSSSADAVRDVRGFAVKFYTEEGNFDLVGNNIPVFFIQDAIKFPDLIHAVKQEPHHGMPQAASAHDNFWDFVTLIPESTHMLLWAMSDRAIPRSYRMMQGFGIHTFRLVNGKGHSTFVKFHWRPKLGTHSLIWDEAVKINGCDADFHRRDLWEAIEAGQYPEWEFGLQIFSEEQAAKFPFDILDATKLVPEELVPITYIGRMVLDRNPDNFFAETEQVAFHPGHVVPGIDFSDDPLLQGRLFSYTDTQLIRLGGPNSHQIPINRAVCPVHNLQRDGHMQQNIPQGRVNYEPNSLQGGCPMQNAVKGFSSFPEPQTGAKIRVRPESFGDHYSQATLFWKSQTPVEQDHIVGGFQFELAKVETPAVRERAVSNLSHVDPTLAARVADALGIPAPASSKVASVHASPALSLMHLPGELGVATRKVAILLTPGADLAFITKAKAEIEAAGAVPKVLAAKLDPKSSVPIAHTIVTTPPVLFDAVIVPPGPIPTDRLALDFIHWMYRHFKTIGVGGAPGPVLKAAGIPSAPEDEGIVELAPGTVKLDAFLTALGKHRHWGRPLL
ncbi:catalase [Bryobacter aggregatus]|uniref:catalase n=1 Tax=Bryobacter aggregatus TaxID=360054 RepID=UPI00068E26D5|nr:catalase [Bryobacter aggregatus]